MLYFDVPSRREAFTVTLVAYYQKVNQDLTFSGLGRVAISEGDEVSFLFSGPVYFGLRVSFGIACQASLAPLHHAAQLADPDDVCRFVHRQDAELKRKLGVTSVAMK